MDISVLNPHLQDLPVDYLYHLGLDSTMDLKSIFGDTKFVCMGGSNERAKDFAEKTAEVLGLSIPHNRGLKPIGKTDRFSLYKVGPVISVSHGMGMPSMSILLNEITKLLHYAECADPLFIRIGTSGGIGVKPGSVVVTEQAVNAELEPVFEHVMLGSRKYCSTNVDALLAAQLLNIKESFPVVLGKTMGTDDFYEGQARFDGALDPPYSPKERELFWKLAHLRGVRNIEMESTMFAAFCSRARIPAGIVCAVLLDRLKGDQVNDPPSQLAQYSDNAQKLVLDFIVHQTLSSPSSKTSTTAYAATR
ncbi:uridine phosphorylase [Candidatus Peregrinibacteria bacterium]|nr:uridine phosphorylase [Candidatus Peregrinibacteria bacterium]